ncbi:MAG: molybdopterin-dependent oxidoreductase, partial [Kofleriaceae bacterium]
PDGPPGWLVAWDERAAQPARFDPARGVYEVDPERLALFGARELVTPSGTVVCRPAFELVAQRCRDHSPARAEAITGVAAADIERTARTLWEARPLAYYTWSGLEQHSNTTQAVRAIAQLYALIGSLDAPGGNVWFPSVRTSPIEAPELLSPEQRAKAVGVGERPLGPARFEFVTAEDAYTAMLEARPYRIRGLVNLGANLVMGHGDSARGRDALASLDWFVHADLFMSPTAELADIVLPVTSAFEAEALRVGFEVSAEAQAHVQLRQPVVAPRGQARSDLQIIFALATRLGLGEHFFHGDLDAAWRYQLAPSGVSLEQLRATPEGIRVPLTTQHHKHAVVDDAGVPRGFPTPTRKIELYSETMQAHGYGPLPAYTEPLTSPRSRPDLAPRFPLVLTTAKPLWFCESQHRQLASLRRRLRDPQVELHPETAAARDIHDGDWVLIETPHGSVRARASLDARLDPGVVCGQHGWWQGCRELDEPGYPPFGDGSANLNLVLPQGPSDPISGSPPLRSYVCNVTRLIEAAR